MERLARALPEFDGARASIWTAQSVGLVHRLYIVTPEDRFERQPWVSRDGAHHLVFAGRLDNRDELAAALGLTPAALRDTADGALCLAAIERWGDEAPAHLFGGFAFACWHSKDKDFLLCRDRIGERTLYFHRGPGFIAFATTMNALLALPDVSRRLDETIMGDLIADNLFEMRRTLYRGIERILPGELAHCRRGDMTMRRYWRPQRRTLGLKTHDDVVDAAREQLDRAVARAMRSATTVATEATGGLDSSGVAATAARLIAPGRLAVYTRVPPPGFSRPETAAAYSNERPRIEALARMHTNMDVTFVDDADPHAFDLDPSRFFMFTALPVRNVHNLGWFSQLNDRVAAAGHRVMITGVKGNFSLGWHGQQRLHQLVGHGRLPSAAKEALALRRLTGQSIGSILRQFILEPREPRFLRNARRRWRGLGAGQEHTTFLAPAFAGEHRLVERIEEIGGWSTKVQRSDPFDMRTHWLFNAGEFSRDFRAQILALHGFEIRDPLGDPRLIEFCLNVPEEHYWRDGRPRALQRDVTADRVPPVITGARVVRAAVAAPRRDPRRYRDVILADIERIARSPLASRAIDVDGLRLATQQWPADAQAARAAGAKFRYGLPRAVHLGNFICWFEGSNR